jgi:hydroxymethylpyrimidine/phosphomethylpyrimidine kinase
MQQTLGVPVVMAFSGNDPTGGAGIQADIEAIASQGCHVAPVITALTVQDTTDLTGVAALGPDLIIQQARAVLEDMPVRAFKIGLIGSVEIAQALHSILVDYPDIPVILDPVLRAGGGAEIADHRIIDAMTNLLVPLATIITPNLHEAMRLVPGADTPEAAAMALLEFGSEFVLVTGTHANTHQVINTLYGNRRALERFKWERLQGSYHGSGCTLASAIAGLLAQGQEPFTACYEAQEYTWQALRHGYRVGMGQQLPNRLFWANEEEPETELA